VSDTNGQNTTMGYDALGRLTKVWAPDQPTSGPPGKMFVYDITSAHTSSVQTKSLISVAANVGTYLTSWAYYDGLLRNVESQSVSPTSSHRIVTYTAYGSRGEVNYTIPATDATGAAGSAFYIPAVASLPSQTSYTYDARLRPTQTTLSSLGVAQWHSNTSYDGTTSSTYTPPADTVTHATTTTTVDALGHQVSRSQTSGTTTLTTLSSYDGLGQLSSLTDATGHTATYGYDLTGRTVDSYDPDANPNGVHTLTTYAVDSTNARSSTTDASGKVVWTVYDDDERAVAVTADQPAGTAGAVPLLTNVYGGTGTTGVPANGYGHLLSSTTYDTAGHAYTEAPTGFDVRGRALGMTWTIPSNEGALAGSYTAGYHYDVAGRPSVTDFPAAGGLAAESVTQSYDGATGLPSTLSGSSSYVTATGYFGNGLLSGRTLSSGTAAATTVRAYGYEAATQRLSSVATTVGGASVQDVAYGWDKVNNLLSVSPSTGLSAGNPNQCFGYDGFSRLSGAWTNGSAACASAANPDTAYNLSYGYAADGNLTSGSSLASTGAVQTRAYAYSGVGAGPHAATTIGTDTQTFDTNGQLKKTVTSAATTFYAWNALHQLTGSGPTSGSPNSTFVYDGSGARLVRHDPTSTTLYVAGMEVRLVGSVQTATRYYSSGGVTVGMRTPTAITWLVNDGQASTQWAVTNTSGAVSTARAYYTPYGQLRPATTTPKALLGTDRGFLGKTNDPATGLDLLGARYYNPIVGQFLSTDPLSVTATAATQNPYLYAAGNPTSLSDPTGLDPCGGYCAPPADPHDNPQPVAKHKTTVVCGGRAGCSPGTGDGNSSDDAASQAANAVAAGVGDFVGGIWSGVSGLVTSEVKCAGFNLGACGSAIENAGSIAEGLSPFALIPQQVQVIKDLSNGDVDRAIRHGVPLALIGLTAAAGGGGGALADRAAVAAEGATEGGSVFRGVASDHPGFDEALNGNVTPRSLDGTATPEMHNLGITADSPFTSWTRSLDVARRFAGEDGVVLRVPTGPSSGLKFEWSPDQFLEQEVLIRGPVTGATVVP
jgi:RHS repeat-associated protein